MISRIKPDMSVCSCDLLSGVINAWTLNLRGSDAALSRCIAILAPDEIARAEQYRLTHHRREFVFARAVLRLLLSCYLEEPPAVIEFAYGRTLKPRLACRFVPVHFNLTHSGLIAVYAMSSDTALGVDIERIQSFEGLEALAERYFCTEEAVEVKSLPPASRAAGFFSCWTRKEAYVKATGEGLSVPLNSFRVTLRREETARFVHIGGSEAAAAEWRLRELAVAPGYVGALAYRGSEKTLRSGTFQSVDDAWSRLTAGASIT